MSLDYIRQIVSGNKARYVDPDNAIDLDLVYVTDRIIIMGWPATGWAAAYRNRRRDVLKFVESRHGDKWWVWNLCPVYENAYSATSMKNRVSRYPFPDHHPPPLPLLPLAVAEMRAWLDGDTDRAAIIHCKAGKGRSGTLLCSYMLSLKQLPGPPSLPISYSAKERQQASKTQANPLEDRTGWVLVGHGDEVDEVQMEQTFSRGPSPSPAPSDRQRRIASPSSATSTLSDTISSVSIDVQSYSPIDVGDERPLSDAAQYDRRDGKVDAVFKLHSTRRMKPTSSGRGVSIPSQRRWCRYVHLLFSGQSPPTYHSELKVRIVSITMILDAAPAWQKPITHLLAGGDEGRGKAWISIARYDDDYVNDLDSRITKQTEAGAGITWGGVGGTGEFDKSKMFRACGKLKSVSTPPELEDEAHVVHHLEPSTPLVLQRRREFRMKLHLGSLPLGWAWMIPAFHLPEPSAPRVHTLIFPKSQIDFAIGPGSAIREIQLRLEELSSETLMEPAPLLSEREEQAAGLEDTRGERVKEEGE